MAQFITKQQGKLVVPDQPVIPVIEGDGVGAELWAAANPVFDRAVEKAYAGKRKIQWKSVLAGQRAQQKCGTSLPDETLLAFQDALVGIKGPLLTPVGEGHRSLTVALRQTLDLFVCQRPVKWFDGVDSPLKHPERVDMVIFRENTEDIYAGIEWAQGTDEVKRVLHFLQNEMNVSTIRFPKTSAIGIKPVSVEGSERLIRAAIEYALEHHLPSVTLVHKGNIMKFTEGGFKQWGYALAEREFGDRVFTMAEYARIEKSAGKSAAQHALEAAIASDKVVIKDIIADNFLQNSLLKPQDYSVIATLNLNGDYISDQLAAMVGGVGISPGANLNLMTGHAIFEATHGVADDIAGQNRANPSSLLLSGVMMFDYLGWVEAADLIRTAMQTLFKQHRATEDLARLMENGQTLSTTEFTQALYELM